MNRTILIVRVAAGLAAMGLGAVPVLFPAGWEPLLATGAAGLLAGVAVFGD